MVQVLSLIFNILAVVAVVLACVALVYFLTVLFDKYSRFCCPGNDTLVLTPEELIERQSASQLIKRAGLAGILPNERVLIFRHFLEQRAVVYTVLVPEKDQNESTDPLQTSKAAKKNANDTVKSQQQQQQQVKVVSVKPSATTSAASNDKTLVESNEQEFENLCGAEHDEVTCPICLSEYGA
jgi:cell division protein FtsW (lipid II flippase)